MTYPILEYDSTPLAFIEPSQVIQPRDVPEACVICFFQEVIDKVVTVHQAQRFSGKPLGRWPTSHLRNRLPQPTLGILSSRHRRALGRGLARRGHWLWVSEIHRVWRLWRAPTGPGRGPPHPRFWDGATPAVQHGADAISGRSDVNRSTLQTPSPSAAPSTSTLPGRGRTAA
jgi:hypothetical protein